MTNAIEQTRIAMYDAFTAMKAGGRWLIKKENSEAFESALEAHLEALRQEIRAVETRNNTQRVMIEADCDIIEGLNARLSSMKQERDDIQGRLHAIDHAYSEQSMLVGSQALEIDRLKIAAQVAGEELQHAQSVSRSRDTEVKAARQLLTGRDEIIGEFRAELTRVREISLRNLDDCRSAEKLSDDLSEKLTQATTVIGQQEQLIVGQRMAIAEMHMTGRSATATLHRLGYSDCGGQLWKPPLGKRPHLDVWCTDPLCAHCKARADGQ